MPKNDFSAGKRVLLRHDFCRKFFNFLKNLKEKMTVPIEIMGFLLMVFLPNVAKLHIFWTMWCQKMTFLRGREAFLTMIFLQKLSIFWKIWRWKWVSPTRMWHFFNGMFTKFCQILEFFEQFDCKKRLSRREEGFFFI